MTVKELTFAHICTEKALAYNARGMRYANINGVRVDAKTVELDSAYIKGQSQVAKTAGYRENVHMVFSSLSAGFALHICSASTGGVRVCAAIVGRDIAHMEG